MPETPDSAASLDQLNDIVVDNLFAVLPLAPGAIFLLVLLAVFTLVCMLRAWRRYRHNAYRRVGLNELRQARAQLNIAALPVLMKRIALTAYGTKPVADLSGAEWLKFLSQTGNISQFTMSPGTVLCELPYKPEIEKHVSETDKALLFELCKKWILGHKELSP